MEAKKTEEADLQNKSTFFFSIGLLISVSLAFVAFEWKQYDKSDIDLINKSVDFMEETMEVPPTVQPPPPKPVVQQPQVIEVPDEKEIEEDLDLDFDTEVTEETVFEPVQVEEAPEEEVDEIFVIVENTAEYPGGLKAFYEYCGKNIKYPAQARRMGVEGRVFVEFVVGKDGALTDFKVQRGLGAGLDEEALRVLKACPKWKPARQGAKIVRQRMVIPITFRLD